MLAVSIVEISQNWLMRGVNRSCAVLSLVLLLRTGEYCFSFAELDSSYPDLSYVEPGIKININATKSEKNFAAPRY